MTPELRWLTYTALLAGSLWIPFIVGVNVTDFANKEQLFVRPPDANQMKPWVHRSLRAHQNLLEQLLPFAIVVLAGAVSRVSTPITVACSITFCSRVKNAALSSPGSIGSKISATIVPGRRRSDRRGQ